MENIAEYLHERLKLLLRIDIEEENKADWLLNRKGNIENALHDHKISARL